MTVFARHKIFPAFLVGVLLALILLSHPATAWAASPADEQKPADRVIFGEDFVLTSGETLPGDLVVFGGNATLEEDSTVTGSVVVFGGELIAQGHIQKDAVVMGGSADINGQVNGDLVLLGGVIVVGPQAEVKGDLVVIGGNLERDPLAQVHGRVVRGFAERRPLPNAPSSPGVVARTWDARHALVKSLWNGIQALVLAGLAALFALFAPRPLERTGRAAEHYPWQTVAVGLAASLLAIGLIVILAITILGLPLALLVAMILGLAYLLGLMGLGWLLGHRLLRALGREWPLAAEAALGTLLLMLLFAVLDVLSCLGWPVQAVLSLAAFGAALLTYLGTRSAETVLARWFPTRADEEAAAAEPGEPNRALPTQGEQD